MVSFVNGNDNLFNSSDWFNILKNEYENLIKNKKAIGKYETEDSGSR